MLLFLMLTDDDTFMLLTDDDTFDRLSIDYLSIVHLLFTEHEAKSIDFWSCYLIFFHYYSIDSVQLFKYVPQIITLLEFSCILLQWI